MTQDTRKDRRVKIVSLNVRYKSATVDEFIENHAHDVSRGGIYIKTANPFPPGTLLKFEIRLASDQAVIAGVGRVVWKRDPTQSNGERPAGMGVKFIKIDEPSKSVIDKLVNTRDDAGRAYESEPETSEQPTPIAALPVPAQAAAAAKPASTSSGAVGGVPLNRKATMIGMGTTSQASAGDGGGPSHKLTPAGGLLAPGAHAAPPRATGGAMFPETKGGEAEQPKAEQTVMKQAAELLEEALREAGGSMEEIGTNPLFTGSEGAKAGAAAKDEKKASTPADEPKEEKKASTPAASRGADGDEAARARAMVAEMSPAPVRRSVSEPPPRTSRESPEAKRPTPGAVAPAAKKGGGGTFILLFVVVAAAAIGLVMFRDQIFGGGTPATTTTAAQLPPPPPPATTSAPVATDTASAPTAAASAAPSASAAASASASAAPSATAPAVARPTATAVARPTATAAQTAAATATAAPTQTATATAAPTAATTAAPTSTGTAAATAAPKPRPKPTAKPGDDNPY